MPQALHSLLVYEEIVANTTLRMMTKLTDAIQPANRYWDNDEKRSEAFRKAFIVATEATLIERKRKQAISIEF